MIPAAILLTIFALVPPMTMTARVQARKSASRNNLKQIGLAFVNYHDSFAMLPPGGTIRDDGVALHGWSATLMPFLDSSPFFNMIHFERPWNDVENQYLFRWDIPYYQIPGVPEMFTSAGYGLTHSMANANVFHRNSVTTFKDMTAGTSQTILAGEVSGNYQPYGYPFNWRTFGDRLNSGSHTYGRPTADGAFVVFADASARFLSNDISPDVLNRLANVPPLANHRQTWVPANQFQYSTSAWERTHIELDELDEVGLMAVAHLDHAHTPYSVVIMGKSKRSWRSPTLADLKQIVAAFPKTCQLFGAIDLNDDAAAQLASLANLEVIQASSIAVSPRGVNSLSRLPALNAICVGRASQRAQTNLKAALPDCEIRVRSYER